MRLKEDGEVHNINRSKEMARYSGFLNGASTCQVISCGNYKGREERGVRGPTTTRTDLPPEIVKSS